jgi:hypothetical protein
MKKSKRYIKKQNNKPLINKKVLAKVMGRRFYGLITVLELLKIQKLLYLKMVDLLVILV